MSNDQLFFKLKLIFKLSLFNSKPQDEISEGLPFPRLENLNRRNHVQNLQTKLKGPFFEIRKKH